MLGSQCQILEKPICCSLQIGFLKQDALLPYQKGSNIRPEQIAKYH